jgi:hypothetical protein
MGTLGSSISYLFYKVDIQGALAIISCGVLILLTLKVISLTISVVTLGIARI